MPRRTRKGRPQPRPDEYETGPRDRQSTYTRDPRLLEALAMDLVRRGLCSAAILDKTPR